MRALRLAGLAVLAAVLLSPSGDAPTTEGSSPEQEVELEARLKRLEQIAQAVDEIERLQEQRLFWIRFLDALYRAKPEGSWFTCVQPLTGPTGESKLLIGGYVEYSSRRRPIWVPCRPIITITEEEAVAAVLDGIKEHVEYLDNFSLAHTDASAGTFRTRARFWIVADFAGPTGVPGKPSEPLPTAQGGYGDLPERIWWLTDRIERPDLPDGYVWNDVTTNPRLVTPYGGETQCERCGWIRPSSLRWCPRCVSAPADRRRYPLIISRIHSEDVDVLFSGFVVGPGGDPDVIDPRFWSVSLRYGVGSKTEIVRLRADWHGFSIGPLTKTHEEGSIRTGPRRQLADVYVLTIQRRLEEPIKLVMNRRTQVKERSVDFAVVDGRDAGKETRGKRLDDWVSVNGNSYRIVVIRDDSVSLVRPGDDLGHTIYWKR